MYGGRDHTTTAPTLSAGLITMSLRLESRVKISFTAIDMLDCCALILKSSAYTVTLLRV